jgi:putative FmdB family regulatory protein
MPIYEYECTQCGQIEEVLQKFSDKPRITCRHCAGRLNKLVSQSSFRLKGSGWYVTDYAKKSTNSSNSSQKETESSSDDSKPTASKSNDSTSNGKSD